MNCRRVASENIIEDYLAEKLSGTSRDAFELHYFECEECFEQLETLRLIRPILAKMPAPLAAKAARQSRSFSWVWMAAAAVIVAVIFGYWPRGGSGPETSAVKAPPPTVALLQLAEIQPAPYSPTVFRSASKPPGQDFERAMQHYQSRQWLDASEALLAFARRHPDVPAALHFAGISLLLAGKKEAALTALDRIIAMGSDSPFKEEAQFYRAQALLLSGRQDDAKAELKRLAGLHGDYEAQSRALLARF